MLTDLDHTKLLDRSEEKAATPTACAEALVDESACETMDRRGGTWAFIQFSYSPEVANGP